MADDKYRLEEVFKCLPEELRGELLALAELPLQRTPQANREGQDQNVRSFFGVWDSGDFHSADNDRIDFDLALEYLNPHQ